jgi:hypothetical protein
MRRIVGVFVLCLTLVWAVQAQEVKYDGYQVWRITVRTPAELEQVQQLVRDVWMVRGSVIDVCLSPDEQATLRKAGFTGEVLIPDVGALIRQQKSDFAPQDGSLFTRYLTLDEIYAAMRQLADQNPRLVQMFEIGRSIENRPIYALRLTREPRRARVYRDRPQVVINAMQHAREWITPPVVLYFAYRLVAEYPTNTQVREALDRLEVYVVPVVNPDGYVFTHTTNRLWRKNRRYHRQDIQPARVRRRPEPQLELWLGRRGFQRAAMERHLSRQCAVFRARDLLAEPLAAEFADPARACRCA